MDKSASAHLFHFRNRIFERPEGRYQVDRELTHEAFIRFRSNAPAPSGDHRVRSCCKIDDDIEPSKPGHRRSDNISHLLFHAYVTANEFRYAAIFANALRASFSTLRVPSATNYLYPLSAKPLGSRDANGFGRTRDNGDFSVQTAHGSLLVQQVRPATASTHFTSKP